MGINKSSIYNLSSITKIKGVFSSFNIAFEEGCGFYLIESLCPNKQHRIKTGYNVF